MRTVDEEESIGLLYQEGEKRQKKKIYDSDLFLHNRPAKPQEWKYAAAWVFFTFFAIFLSLLVVKIVSNNFISQLDTTTTAVKMSVSVKNDQNQKPNIIFVLADDLGHGALNQEEFNFAPYLSSLSQDGIIMANYYAQEICAPSRAALLTGRYPASLGMQYGQLLPTHNGGLTLNATLLPEVLKNYGNYKTLAFGKWNLGHSSPDYLPTARGFDHYLGYLTTENTYWTKSMGEYPSLNDFTEADTKNYWAYTGDDMDTYSTELYSSHAQDTILTHNFQEQPLFMYLAFQAAHSPFEDFNVHTDGLTEDDVSSTVWAIAQQYAEGHHRQQYVMALSILDQSVQKIWRTIESVGQAENTYLIFASDNGGCPQDGGNTDYFRGTKGTLFEGGVRVESFLYHPSFKSRGLAREYEGLMHVSDWFSSILGLAGIENVDEVTVDGHNHVPFWFTQPPTTGDVETKATDKKAKKTSAPITDGPRDHILYNYYYNVDDVVLDKNINASVAVRDRQYKLIRTFVGNEFDGYFDPRTDAKNEDDDSFKYGPQCTQDAAIESGNFTTMLFDLSNDPSETTDLINDPQYAEVVDKLEKLVAHFESKMTRQPYLEQESTEAVAYWNANGMVAQPWIITSNDKLTKTTRRKRA